MRITKSTFIVLVFMLLFSILVANVANLLNTQIVYDTKKPHDSSTQQLLAIEDKYEHLIWFLQVPYQTRINRTNPVLIRCFYPFHRSLTFT